MLLTVTEEDRQLSEEAARYLKAHKKALIERFASLGAYHPDAQPVSIFMAGSPGAGKTEFSKHLAESFKDQPVRIDADEIREWIPDHKSGDASVYQKACTDGVNKLYDHVMKHRLNVIMDGTFAYARVSESVKRSLEHGRQVEIYFLYQDPADSWKFTKDREKLERRNVPRHVFIDAFLKSQINVEQVKRRFGDRLKLNVVVKNFNTSNEYIKVKSLDTLELNVASIEKYLPRQYTKEELEGLLQ